MIEIRKELNARLKSIHPQVYFLRASEKATFPYLVYEFEIIDLEDGLKLLTLDVDGWDNNPDTTALETLMSNVHASFKETTIINESMVVSFHSDRRLPIIDDDASLNRRKYIYLGRLFER